MSNDVFGVDAVGVSVGVAFDFRLSRGKYPSALRGMRRISTRSGKLGKTTQESCLRLSSSAKDIISDSEDVAGDTADSLLFSFVSLPLSDEVV